MITAQSLAYALQQLIDDGDLAPDAQVMMSMPYPTGTSNSGPATYLDVPIDASLWIMGDQS